MKILSIREMRASLGELDKILTTEGEIVIARHGKAIARLLPVHKPVRASHADLRARIARKPPKHTIAQEVRADRDER